MIKVINRGGGDKDPVRTYPVASLALNNGALVAQLPGAAGVSLYTAGSAASILGVTNQSTTTSNTTVDLLQLRNGAEVEADIYEIANGTTLTATTVGSGTSSIGITALTTGANSSLIGAQFQVISIADASATAKSGSILTATSYISSGGSVGFASASVGGSTGFASGDTVKLISVTSRMIGLTKNMVAASGDTVTLAGTSAGLGGFMRLTGVNDAGTRVRGVIINGIDTPVNLTTT